MVQNGTQCISHTEVVRISDRRRIQVIIPDFILKEYEHVKEITGRSLASQAQEDILRAWANRDEDKPVKVPVDSQSSK